MLFSKLDVTVSSSQPQHGQQTRQNEELNDDGDIEDHLNSLMIANCNREVKSPAGDKIPDDRNGKTAISGGASLLLNQQQQQQQQQRQHEHEELLENEVKEDEDISSSEGIVHRIGPIPYRDGLTVADLCDVCDVFTAVPLRPHKNDEDESATSAPFFTAVEMSRRGGRSNRSSMCELL